MNQLQYLQFMLYVQLYLRDFTNPRTLCYHVVRNLLLETEKIHETPVRITDVPVSCRLQTSFNIKKFHILPTEFMCFKMDLRETRIISLYILNRLVFRRLHKIEKSDYQLRHVRPHGTYRLPLDGFSWNLAFENFPKICRQNSISL
jgi:hypothetical protein